MMPGEKMTLRLSEAPPASPLAFILGMQPVSLDLGALGSILVLPTFVVPGGATDAEGKAVFSLPLPATDPLLRNTTLFTQAVVVNGGNVGLSEAVASRVCP